jgi:hypothetical protein
MSVPSSVAYAESTDNKITTREESVFAQASWHTEDSEGQSLITFLFVRESTGTPDSENEVTILKDIELDGEIVTLAGSIFTQEDVFSIDDKNLNTASFPPTEIRACVPFGNICETLTVQADWTGTGDIEKSTSKTINKEEDLKSKFSETTQVREAGATGSIDGEELGESENAQLRKTKSVISLDQ